VAEEATGWHWYPDPTEETVPGSLETCRVHGVVCLGWEVHAATARRERIVAEAAMESNLKMGGVDFHLALVVAAPLARKRATRRAPTR
jgi:hypothetical protein